MFILGNKNNPVRTSVSIDNLIEGYRRFRATRFEEARGLYRELERRGQSPKVLFIACCDSRVDPATITDSGPGELFVIRNVANLVPPYTPDGRHHGTSAALEFAVRNLEVDDIVVMGHVQCGGARALLQGADRTASEHDFIGNWMALAAEVRDQLADAAPQADGANLATQMEHAIVRLSLRNLMTFDWVRERVAAGTLRLHGWYYGIAEGVLFAMDPESGRFNPIPDNG